jgi:hypothetical protein
MQVTKQDFVLWANKVLLKNEIDNEKFELLCGYYVTMSARCEHAWLKHDIYYDGDYDFWRFDSVSSVLDEIWLDFTNAMKHYGEKNPYCKAGRVELSFVECDRIARRGQLIVAYRDIYELHWSNAQGFYYASKVYHYDGENALTKRGRWSAMSARDVNNLLGFELFVELKSNVEMRVMEKLSI